MLEIVTTTTSGFLLPATARRSQADVGRWELVRQDSVW